MSHCWLFIVFACWISRNHHKHHDIQSANNMQTVPGKEFRVESPYATSKQKSPLSLRAERKSKTAVCARTHAPPHYQNNGLKNKTTRAKMKYENGRRKGKKHPNRLLLKSIPFIKPRQSHTHESEWIWSHYEWKKHAHEQSENRKFRIGERKYQWRETNEQTMPQIVTFARKHYKCALFFTNCQLVSVLEQTKDQIHDATMKRDPAQEAQEKRQKKRSR